METLSRRREGGRKGRGGERSEGSWQAWGRGSHGLLFNWFWGFVRGDIDASKSGPQCERGREATHSVNVDVKPHTQMTKEAVCSLLGFYHRLEKSHMSQHPFLRGGCFNSNC